MTELEMNGQPRDLFSTSALLLAGALALGGCASASGRALFEEVPVNKASPAAAQIEAVLAKPGDFPTFADIPPAPTDLPTVESVRADVEGSQAAGLVVRNDTAPETWQLDASDAFAERARADTGDIRAPTDAEIAESEAFAAAARARAKPPPRPK
ncbi:MAG TPA: hypothetical protein VEA44_14600 [Caulobacter sp.]|nr:hypothetical protein [Caulobacter sp.]